MLRSRRRLWGWMILGVTLMACQPPSTANMPASPDQIRHILNDLQHYPHWLPDRFQPAIFHPMSDTTEIPAWLACELQFPGVTAYQPLRFARQTPAQIVLQSTEEATFPLRMIWDISAATNGTALNLHFDYERTWLTRTSSLDDFFEASARETLFRLQVYLDSLQTAEAL